MIAEAGPERDGAVASFNPWLANAKVRLRSFDAGSIVAVAAVLAAASAVLTRAMDGGTPLMSAPLTRSMTTVQPWCVAPNVARRTKPVAAPPLLRVVHRLCCARSAAVVDHWFSEPE